MSNNQFNLHYEAELNEGIRVTTLSPIFCSGDIEAHSFVVKVMRKGKPVNLAGTTVRGFFIRPDNVTITLEGSVNADGEAVVTLSNACYNKQGRFQLVIRVTMGGVISTVFCGLGGMLLTVTDGFIDEDNVIPSLGDLLAQIDAMKEATAAALEAADRANEAAENAESGIGYPVVGTVDADKNIDLTGDLAPGTYTLHYTGKDGTKLSQIVTIELTASEGGGDDTGDTGDTGETSGTIPTVWNIGYTIDGNTGAVSQSSFTWGNTGVVHASEPIELASGRTYRLVTDNARYTNMYAYYYTAEDVYISREVLWDTRTTYVAEQNVALTLPADTGIVRFRTTGATYADQTSEIVTTVKPVLAWSE